MATITLDKCVKTILCSLSSSVLQALQALIDSQKALLQAQIAAFQTQLLAFDVLALPVEATQSALHLIVDDVRQAASLIPLNAITNCVDLGQFNLNIQQSIDVLLSSADDLLFELTRLLSYRDELNAIIKTLNDILDRFTAISLVIEQCLSGT